MLIETESLETYDLPVISKNILPRALIMLSIFIGFISIITIENSYSESIISAALFYLVLTIGGMATIMVITAYILSKIGFSFRPLRAIPPQEK